MCTVCMTSATRKASLRLVSIQLLLVLSFDVADASNTTLCCRDGFVAELLLNYLQDKHMLGIRVSSVLKNSMLTLNVFVYHLPYMPKLQPPVQDVIKPAEPITTVTPLRPAPPGSELKPREE